MSDPIVKAVAHRWKLVASAHNWIDEAEQLDSHAAINNLKQDFRNVKGYKTKCAYLAQIYRKLAEPLETPEIAEYADLMDQRVKDVDQLISMLQGSEKLIAKAEKEFDQLIEDIAKGKKLRGGYIEAVYDLPSMRAILALANEADNLQSRLDTEDNEGSIDWTLEEYLGVEARVYKKIDKTGGFLLGWFAERNFSGVWALYGFLKYHIDSKLLEDLVESAKSELDKGEGITHER